MLQAHLQLLYRNEVIRIVEPVRDVPADRPEVPPLLDDGVEERDGEEETSEDPRLLVAALVEFRVADGIVRVAPDQVLDETRRRFIRHLDTVLEDRHRELTIGIYLQTFIIRRGAKVRP